jgi:hypothetical protein
LSNQSCCIKFIHLRHLDIDRDRSKFSLQQALSCFPTGISLDQMLTEAIQ